VNVKILVTGAAGQLGSAVVERFERSGNHEVIAATREVMDLGDRDAILQVITTAAPDAIVHSGAFTAVDACESEVDAALRINALATRHVVDGAERVNARVLYVSTDYVFDGTKTEAYDEWDAPNPQSVYGRSKLGGEHETRPQDTVVRTSWVFGRNGKNMVKTVLRLIESNPELAFVDDQHGKPTCAEDLAETIYDLTVSRSPGLFHVTNSGPTTWFGFVQDILRTVGESPDRVKPITTADLAGKYPAPRPANSVLDNAALRLNGIPELRHYTEALAETVTAIKNA
jgi:dTDP-4-dehydrorhamnose reductase